MDSFIQAGQKTHLVECSFEYSHSKCFLQIRQLWTSSFSDVVGEEAFCIKVSSRFESTFRIEFDLT